MARCCGSTGTCACKIIGGGNTVVTGMGTSQDPFVITNEAELGVLDTKTFNLTLTGEGTNDNPWNLAVQLAGTAELSDLPDVGDAAPVNGQVLGWSDADQAWVPQPATTAAAGDVLTGTSIEGDGSSGAPLDVTVDPARYLTVTVAGVGLSDEGLNTIIRPFADATARNAADPPATPGAVSMLASNPGMLDYWTGTAWEPVTNGLQLDVQPGQFLQLSGPYAGGAVTQFVKQVSGITDPGGAFTLLDTDDLAGYAGVLSVQVQPTGVTPWACVANSSVDIVYGVAYRLDDGTAYAGYSVSAIVTALLY